MLHTVDVVIVVLFLSLLILVGTWTSRRAQHGVEAYCLGNRQLPWYLLGTSNASGMFDVAGTLWLTTIFLVYGFKSLWLPWLWPTFNQIFLMAYLSIWLRRSRALTGADWLATRFGPGLGLELSHLSVVAFALISVLGYLAYAFEATRILTAEFLPWAYLRQSVPWLPLTPETVSITITLTTSFYVMAGGMHSVVWMDVVQYALLACVSLCIAAWAMYQSASIEISSLVPAGWHHVGFGWQLDLAWSSYQPSFARHVAEDGYDWFGPFFGMMATKGVLASMAGPAPNYDMQRVLAARSEREAALMSGLVSPVLQLPRYALVAGLAVLALLHFNNEPARDDMNLEQVFPLALRTMLPTGLRGLALCGFLAAYMSTYNATLNAGSAYVLNDIYQRYWQPVDRQWSATLIHRITTLSLVIGGIALGLQAGSLDEILNWLTAGLFAGYIAPNVLKWHWWRLNGIGYFLGMLAGTGLALALMAADPARRPLWFFPWILAGSGLACLGGSWWTQPEPRSHLAQFYEQVRPWGFWGPIAAGAQSGWSYWPEPRVARDLGNCLMGTAWQWSLAAFPAYCVVRAWEGAGWTAALIVVTSVWLKFAWYDRLPNQHKTDAK